MSPTGKEVSPFLQRLGGHHRQQRDASEASPRECPPGLGMGREMNLGTGHCLVARSRHRCRSVLSRRMEHGTIAHANEINIYIRGYLMGLYVRFEDGIRVKCVSRSHAMADFKMSAAPQGQEQPGPQQCSLRQSITRPPCPIVARHLRLWTPAMVSWATWRPFWSPPMRTWICSWIVPSLSQPF
jgi:hypothetical protein